MIRLIKLVVLFSLLLSADSKSEAKRSLFTFNIYQKGQSVFGYLKLNQLLLDLNFNLIPKSNNTFLVSFESTGLFQAKVKGEVNMYPVDEEDIKFVVSLKGSTIPLSLDLNSTFINSNFFLKQLNLIAFAQTSHQPIFGLYQLDLRRSITSPKLVFYHNLTTQPRHLLFFSSNLTEHRLSNKNGFPSSIMTIVIELYSSVWQFLNTTLNQIYVFEHLTGYESMNTINSLADVNVVANWSYSPFYKHFKRFEFDSKYFANWIVDYLNDKLNFMQLTIKKYPKL